MRTKVIYAVSPYLMDKLLSIDAANAGGSLAQPEEFVEDRISALNATSSAADTEASLDDISNKLRLAIDQMSKLARETRRFANTTRLRWSLRRLCEN